MKSTHSVILWFFCLGWFAGCATFTNLPLEDQKTDFKPGSLGPLAIIMQSEFLGDGDVLKKAQAHEFEVSLKFLALTELRRTGLFTDVVVYPDRATAGRLAPKALILEFQGTKKNSRGFLLSAGWMVVSLASRTIIPYWDYVDYELSVTATYPTTQDPRAYHYQARSTTWMHLFILPLANFYPHYDAEIEGFKEMLHQLAVSLSKKEQGQQLSLGTSPVPVQKTSL